MMRNSCERRVPPWWPAGEPWPPRPRRFGMDPRSRARFFRRIALGFVAVLALTMSLLFAAARVFAGQIGGPAWSPIPVVLLLCAVFAGAIVLRMMSGAMRGFASPLVAVMDAADRVADGDYAVRVEESGAPPIRALTRSFNTMTERLQNADRVRRDLMADVAHELRTPVSVLQGRLEGILDGVYPRDERQVSQLLEETHVLARLIEDLRTLALSDADALPLQREPADLVTLAQDVARSMQPDAARKSVALHVAGSAESAVLDLDAVRIREVLTNVVSNALQHNPAGGVVTVSVDATSDGAVVSVSDTGPGLPPSDVARMFDRFSKGMASRGSGLGLAIAKGIVKAHGGEIAALSQPGLGTTVTVTLPAKSAM